MTIGPEDMDKGLQNHYDRMSKYIFGNQADVGVITGYNQSLNSKQPTGMVYQNSTNPTIADNIANKVMQPIASGIEKAQGVPVLGWVTNLGLNLAQAIGQYLIDPAMRVITTPLLISEAAQRGKGIDYAWEQAQDISFGQAFANTTFMPIDDIFDAEQRKEKYEDTWLGVIATGGVDLGVNILGSKGTGATVRGGTNLVLGNNTIKNVQAVRPAIDDAIAWGEKGATGAAPNSWAELIDEAVKATSPADLRTSTLVQNSSNPDRLATLLAGTKTHRGVGEIIMAERGDITALNRLKDELPLAHDALTDFGQDMTKPLTQFNDIHKLPEGEEVNQFYKIIDALAEKDEQFAKALDGFVDDSVNGKFLTKWQPGKYNAVDKAKLFPKKFKMAALYGDWGYLNTSKQGGWVVKATQGDRYTRGIRFFQVINGAKARGHINVSNPRMDESAQEILSELNKMLFLRDNLEFRANAIKMFTEAANDSERALAIGRIEQLALIEMAKHYNVENMGDLARAGANVTEQVNKLRKLHDDLNSRRQSSMNFLQDHGFIVDIDGNINFIKGADYAADNKSIVLTSTEAQNVPMMDLARLETHLINKLRELEKTPEGAVGSFNLSKKAIRKGKYAESIAGQTAMTIGQWGDYAHMLFSNLHLLRVAFIPKNSFLDNIMRASMVLERVMGLSGGAPKLVAENLANNSVRRITRIYPKAFQKRFGKESLELDKTLSSVKSDMDNATKLVVQSRKAVQKSEARVQRLTDELKTITGKTPEDTLRRNQIQSKLADETDRLKNLQTDYDVNRSAYDNFSQARKTVLERKAVLISQLEDEKAALNYLGKEKFTYNDKDGNIIEVEGVWDPNTKGSSAFKTEVDAYASWYEQQSLAAASLRVRNQNNWVELKYNPANIEGTQDFWEAVTHHINMHIRTNEVGRKMLEGMDDDAIFNWLRKTADGREYVRRLKNRIDSDGGGIGVSDEALYGWLAYVRNNIGSRLPSAELRDIALKRPVTSEEVSAWLTSYGDNLPSIYGPTNNTAYKSMTFGEKIRAVGEAIPNFGWKQISKFENKIARMPLYREYWKEEATAYAKYLEANGFKITPELLSGAIRQTAHRKALARVEDTLYSSRRLTNGMYAMRYVMAFPAAYFNSQKVALKLMARNPYNAYWYNSVMNSFDSGGLFGAYYQNTETGEVYESLKDVPDGVDVSVRFNIAEVFGESVEEKLRENGFDAYLDAALGGPGIPQKQLEFMLGDPSLAWTASATLAEVIKMADGDSPVFGNVTGMQIIDGLKNAFGEDFYNNSIFFQGNLPRGENILETLKESMIPTTYKQLLSARFGDQADQRLVDEANRLYRMQYRDWYVNGSDPRDKPVYEESIKAARNVLTMRAFIAFNAPLSISFDPASREAMMRYSQLMDKYKNSPQQYELATDDFVKLYGVGSLSLLGSSNYRLLGQSATASNQEILYNHRDLIERISSETGNPESAEILFWSPDGDSGDYKSEIAVLQERMSVPGTGGQKIVRPKTAQEVRDDIEKRIGWYEYTKLDQLRQAEMEVWGIGSTSETRYSSTGMRSRFMEAERALREKYPAWDRSRQFNTQNWYTVIGDAVNTILADQKWMKRPESNVWNEIAVFMNMSNQVRSLYEAGRSSNEMSYYREMFEMSYRRMLGDFSPAFGAFASRWLSNHPLLNPDVTEEVIGG